MAHRSGLEILQAMGTGELPPPPVMHTLGMSGIEVAEGRIVFRLEPQEFHYNPRPVTVRSGTLRCEGMVLSRGNRVALAQAQVFDGSDRLVAHATSSCLIFPIEGTPR